MLDFLQLILALLLTGAILLQGKGGGLGSAFGSGFSYHTKRGAEKTLFFLTIALSLGFIIVAFLNSTR